MRLADLMFWAWLRSTRRFITNGLNSSSAICFGRPHWCSLSCGPSTMTERPECSTRLPSRFWRNRPCLPLSMSESDFSGRLPGPVTGRPRRPLSNSASTASCRMRFSLLTMISGAPRAGSRLRRLVPVYLGRAGVEQPLEAVVAVDDAAVEVVEIRGRETAAVELDHRAQLRRDDRDGLEDHVLGLVVGVQEGREDLQALDRAGLLLALAVLDLVLEVLAVVLEHDAQLVLRGEALARAA